MSAIARYFKFKGLEVSGYDRTPSELTSELEKEGIAVHYEDRPDLIPKDKEGTLVVYTPAIPQELGELRAVREGGYKVVKRSQILGEITRGQCCLAVAGTHGKTTTSTLVAHILTSCGEGCSAFLGGISRNYGTNMLMSHNPVVVAEADEFDRSFHQLHPQIAAITAMDADHLDIYGDLEHVQQAYRIFASQVSDVLIHKLDLPLERSVTAAKMYSYHLDDSRADFRASRLRLSADGHYTYDMVTPGGVVEDIRVGTLGRLNVENRYNFLSLKGVKFDYSYIRFAQDKETAVKSGTVNEADIAADSKGQITVGAAPKDADALRAKGGEQHSCRSHRPVPRSGSGGCAQGHWQLYGSEAPPGGVCQLSKADLH